MENIAPLPAITQHPGDRRSGLANRVRPNADNRPHSFELFLLGPGEKKVTYTIETRVPNAAVFVFEKEDHTLGNLLRHRLIKSPHILFAAYKVPHPLFARFELRVQTDGDVTPKDAVIRACEDIVKDLSLLQQEFTKEWELKKIAGQGRVDL